MNQRQYIAIDLKSFYASVECADRGLDPLTTNLVVADKSRTDKTICLAVSPSLKAYSIAGRARLFEVVRRVKEINRERRKKILYSFTKKSVFKAEIDSDPNCELDYIVAPPRMARYIEVSTQIYRIYLRFVSKEDIHVYSIDEVFIDVTSYIKVLKISAREFAERMIKAVLKETKITATAGIGSNLYLCKIAMDIVAKHIEPDSNGVRIAELNEHSYREKLWNHKPLTDFWRVGRGTVQRLSKFGIDTMGKIARVSITNEGFLYDLFGVNAELLIDHAWGYEPCTIAHVKAYKPSSNSISSGQVLSCPYDFKKARVVIREMADSIALDLVKKNLVTSQIVITVGYDVENLKNNSIASLYQGDVSIDYYGRQVPKNAHGTQNLDGFFSSGTVIVEAVTRLFDRIVNPNLLVRRLNVSLNVVNQDFIIESKPQTLQLDLFTDYEAIRKEKEKKKLSLEKERRMQQAEILIKQRFGKNAILKGLNFEDGATAKERNSQIGGHKA